MKVVIYERMRATPPEVRALWSSLTDSGSYNPSVHPDWLEAALTAWGLVDSTAVAVIHAGANTVAVIPFLLRRRTLFGLPLKSLELATNICSYHAEIVGSGDVEKALALFLADRQLPAWDALLAVNLVTNGPTSRAIRAAHPRALSGISARAGERSPYVVIDRDWTGYLATRPKKVRSNVTRSLRLMRQAGETGMEWYENDCDAARLLQDVLAIESRSWKASAGVAIVAGTPQNAYYERLLPWLAARRSLMANVLYVQNQPVAYTLCVNWRGWIGQLKTSFVHGLRDAGSRVIHSSLERAFQREGREYDFLGDAAPHKMRWADAIREHEQVWAFPRHFRGRAFRSIKTVADSWHRRHEAKLATAESSNEAGESRQ